MSLACIYVYVYMYVNHQRKMICSTNLIHCITAVMYQAIRCDELEYLNCCIIYNHAGAFLSVNLYVYLDGPQWTAMWPDTRLDVSVRLFRWLSFSSWFFDCSVFSAEDSEGEPGAVFSAKSYGSLSEFYPPLSTMLSFMMFCISHTPHFAGFFWPSKPQPGSGFPTYLFYTSYNNF